MVCIYVGMLKLDLNTVLIIGLVGYIAIKDSCNTPTEPAPIQRDTSIIYYTPPPITVTLPPTPPTKVIIREIPAQIDSLQVVQDYFTFREYDRNFKTDSIEISVKSKLFRNELDTQTVTYTWLAPPCSTLTITERITLPPTRKVLVGLNLSYTDKISIMPMVAYQPKTGHLFMAGYNGVGGSVGYLHRVSIKRK